MLSAVFQEKEDSVKLRAGQPIRLFHKEIEAYLVAEGLFDDDITEDGMIKVNISHTLICAVPNIDSMKIT